MYFVNFLVVEDLEKSLLCHNKVYKSVPYEHMKFVNSSFAFKIFQNKKMGQTFALSEYIYRKSSRSGPKLRILDRFQTPQNANNLVQQVCALNPIFPQPANFHESMMSEKSQTVSSSQTDNIRTPFKYDIMVVKRL